MPLLRISEVTPLNGHTLRLVLTDGSTVERDITSLLVGPVLEALAVDGGLFAAVQVDGGTVVWPNGADLDPDVLIWGGAPPEADALASPPRRLKLQVPSAA